MEPFLLNLDDAEGSLCRLLFEYDVTGLGVSNVTDRLYVTTVDGFAEFVGGKGVLDYDWTSGDRLYPQPVNFAAGIVDAVGSATLEVFAEGALRGTVPIENYTAFRLPSGPPAYAWSVRVVGAATVREVSLASSFMEIKRV